MSGEKKRESDITEDQEKKKQKLEDSSSDESDEESIGPKEKAFREKLAQLTTKNAVVLNPDASSEILTSKKLADLQKAVGGNIQMLPFLRSKKCFEALDPKFQNKRYKVDIFVNEEGLLKQLESNDILPGYVPFRFWCQMGFLVGPAVFCIKG